jgi:hypothetical protein
LPVIGGFSRFRKNQWGYQGSNTANTTTVGTAAAATRIVPWNGFPDINPNWTDPELDMGRLVQVSAPFGAAWDQTLPQAGPVHYDFLPYILSAVLHGGVTPTGGGAAKTWTFQPPSDILPPLGLFTIESGNDIGDPSPETPSDWVQLVGAFAESAEFSGPDTGSVVQLNASMRAASAGLDTSTAYPPQNAIPTALTPESDVVPVFATDLELYINDTAGAIGTTKISDTLVSWTLTHTHNPDMKHFANGSNTRFETAAFGLGEFVTEFEAVMAMNSSSVGTGSESDDWIAATPTKRFFELRITSPSIITGSTPYSWSIRFPLYYKTRTYQVAGGNEHIALRGKVVHDATLGYHIREVVVCSRTAL